MTHYSSGVGGRSNNPKFPTDDLPRPWGLIALVVIAAIIIILAGVAYLESWKEPSQNGGFVVLFTRSLNFGIELCSAP